MKHITNRRHALRTLAAAGAATLAAPHIAGAQAKGTTWKVQTSWPGGVGLQIFKDWCASIAEKTGGELAFQPFGANDVVGDFQLYDAVKNGVLDAVNPFTIYAQGIIPAATFLTSIPLGLRQPSEFDTFYYGLGGLDIARELYAKQGMYFVGPIHHDANIIHSKVPIRSIDDFRGRKMRLPGGMVAEVFSEIGAETTVLPGSEIFPALEKGTIDVADYVGPAVNYALGFSQVTNYIVMGPPGFMSLYQPVDIMDLTVGMDAWNALSPQMQQFVEMETHVYSDMHYAAIQEADQEAWKKFEADGTEVTRLSQDDVELMTEVAAPIWFKYANRDPDSARVFKIQLDYMMSGSLGYVTPELVDGLELKL
ncbi:MAG: TRAP transporter substrate-binding protein DctP [Thioclava marina]|jgi:TRAP-type mannitol/chloroaromatic compound transport system, periplasmic component|uniref:ABC transporter substrate-binding protein n=1 Tax=Thioclava marina TaxID=1915077 RepID=A0ABX3MIT7_9RHOB|nr:MULTISPECIES: TRAP transporter substrate-binding protein DctP [Thioclava]TNF14997.1 MAG: ABC transporter substrate-binding protein [Paracoccaceae bacterium]MBC7144024.1 TRAP transporter substrate-binding protein DctP [Thioclava marina]MBD3805082.1 TRAP transporter substrate-binding protein DctP [Thioclava sp.]OOY11282.1 ABC transporter substrate-binding protein [Thioclava marina]OOY26995.1 ABC transporter substrate-binding protein [Thioclava sp. L04-15]